KKKIKSFVKFLFGNDRITFCFTTFGPLRGPLWRAMPYASTRKGNNKCHCCPGKFNKNSLTS
ncbi:hypothetical protein KA005_18775, partial [bacterium]|nr:hypothetical protein [bacterium]